METLNPSIVLWFLLAVGPAMAQEDPPSGSNGTAAESQAHESAIAEHVSVNNVTSDEAIQSRLNEILRATKWFEGVNVEVHDSVAFLNGMTLHDEHKDWAGSLARSTEGVAAVVNRIQVKKTIDVADTLRVVTSSIKTLWKDFLFRSPLIIAGILLLVATALVSKLANAIVSRVAKRSRLRSSLQDLLLQLLTIGVWVVGLLVTAVVVFPGMTPSKALTVLGLGSVAIGFAFKDIFENFFAGILILWKYPFDRGDFIQCNDITGRIEDITIRMTMIRQVDGQLVVVPNAMLFKNPVDVLTSGSSRRTTVMCGVAYDTNLDEARDVLQNAIKSCSSVRQDQPVQIFAQEFADSSINFELTWWAGAEPVDIRESRDEVVRAVKRSLDEANIAIPFPQRTLWLPEPIRTQAAPETANGLVPNPGSGNTASND